MTNWVIALGGTLMIAVFISIGFSTWDRTAFLLTFQIGGPYLLLGLGCQISHKTAEARALGFLLSFLLLVVPLFLLILTYVLASLSGPCGALGIMFLLIPLMWLYSFVSFAVLLGKRLLDRVQKNENAEWAAGGCMRICPGACTNDGELNVIIISPAPIYRIVTKLFSSIAKGTHIDLPEVEYLTGRKIEVHSEPPAVLDLDGELFGTTPATFSICPLALEVMCMAKSRGEIPSMVVA